MSMQQTLLEPGIQFAAPGSQTFGPGSNSFVVPLCHTLQIELWGGGASGGGVATYVVGVSSSLAAGNNGGQTAVGAYSLFANGGVAPTNLSNNSALSTPGGSASGGTTNISGSNGLTGSYIFDAGGTNAYGYGGGGGNGANGGAGGTEQPHTQTAGRRIGHDGNAPSGGGSGCSHNPAAGGSQITYTSGGSGGGYCSRTFTVGFGAHPTWQDVISFVVGAAGGAVGADTLGGAGTNGQIKFTWS